MHDESLATAEKTKTSPKSDILAPVKDAQREAVKLQQTLKTLEASMPSGHDSIRARLKPIEELLQKLEERLAAPQITLATVGTTSSGKSTLLNGILGRQLAPMDADEMSAGLLEINQADQWTLELLDQDLPGIPPKGQLTTAHIYQVVRGMMQNYHQEKQTKEPPFLHFKAAGPLYPMMDHHPFQQNVGRDIRFAAVDLPGLRTTNDPENLRVIRSRIKQAFNIIVLDYGALPQRESRQKLMEELDEIVRELGGRTSTMLFVLNRVDLRTKNDDSLDLVISRLKAELEERIRPAEPLDLISFSGLLYSYATQLFTSFIEGDLDAAKQAAHKLQVDCNPIIQDHIDALGRKECIDLLTRFFNKKAPDDSLSDEDLRFEIEDLWTEAARKFRRFPKQDGITTTDLIFAAQLAIGASGHERLWDALLEKIKNNAGEVLVYPEVSTPRQELEKFTRELKGYATTQQIQTTQQLDDAIEALASARVKVREAIDTSQAEILKNIHALQDWMDTQPDLSDPTNRSLFNEHIIACGGTDSRTPTLIGLPTLIEQLLKDNLGPNIFTPAFEYLLEQPPARHLIDKFTPKFGVELATQLSDTCDYLTKSGYTTEVANKGLIDSLQLDHYGDKQTIADAKKIISREMSRFENKYKTMRKYLADYHHILRKLASVETERFLSSISDELAEDLSHMLSNSIHDAIINLVDKAFGDLKDTLSVDYATPTISVHHDTNIEVPADLLTIPDPVEISEAEDERQMTDPSCFGDPEYKLEREIKYEFPSASTIFGRMEKGIRQERNALFQRLINWMQQSLELASQNLQQQFADYFDILNQGFEARAHQLELDAAVEIDLWQDISLILDNFEAELHSLKSHAGIIDDKVSSGPGIN